jgi:hypothetical protein
MAHTNEQHSLALLGQLETILTELGYTGAQVVNQSAELPFPAVLVPLEADAHQRARFMTLMFYPVAELENTLLLQYYFEFPFTVDAAHHAAFSETLPVLNHKSVLGYFGLADGNPKPYFRYVQALPAGEAIEEDQVADVIALLTTTVELLQDVLEAVASGASTVAAARQLVNEKLKA